MATSLPSKLHYYLDVLETQSLTGDSDGCLGGQMGQVELGTKLTYRTLVTASFAVNESMY